MGRIVTTGHDSRGRSAIRSDGPLREGSSVLTLRSWPTSVDDGDDAPRQTLGEGALVVDVVQLDAEPTLRIGDGRPTFDALVVLAGELEVSNAGETTTLHPGNVFLARGHRCEVTANTTGARVARITAVPEPHLEAALIPTSVRSTAEQGRVRRVVAGPNGIAHDGEPPAALMIGDQSKPEVAIVDVWEWGGPLLGCDQGGDTTDGFQLEPRQGGLKILDLELAAVPEENPRRDEGWHATATIDVDLVISGTVAMYVRDGSSVRLRPGDVLLQRGTDHLWQAIGDEPLRMVTIMIGVRKAATTGGKEHAQSGT